MFILNYMWKNIGTLYKLQKVRDCKWTPRVELVHKSINEGAILVSPFKQGTRNLLLNFKILISIHECVILYCIFYIYYLSELISDVVPTVPYLPILNNRHTKWILIGPILTNHSQLPGLLGVYVHIHGGFMAKGKKLRTYK